MKTTRPLIFCLLAGVMLTAQPTAKKLIHFGWNEPHSLANFQNGTLEQLAGNVPFDGIAFRPIYELKRNGNTIRYTLEHPPKTGLVMLEKDDFKEWIVQFRRLKENTRLKYNFFDFSTILFSPNWFDDNAWELTMNNFTTMTWVAKESGFAGLALDIEAYSFGGYPFAFNPELGHSYEETAAQVRKRGKQWIEGITAVFPDMDLHCCFWTSMCRNGEMANHPICAGNYAFAIPFFNGVYDGAPETIRIHDGVESQGYHANNAAAITQIVADFYRLGPAWIAPENREKYHRLTKLSIALYLDSYVPRERTWIWRLFKTTDNPTRLLFENTRLALDYSDEYAWFWCEKGTFWPDITRKTPQTLFWNDRLPYAREAIAAAAKPQQFFAENIGPILNKNACFTPAPDYKPVPYNANIPGWDVSHDDNNPAGTGIVFMDNGGIRCKKCANTNISQIFTQAIPGETYLLTARAKMQSKGMDANINTFFNGKDSDGLWTIPKQACFEQDDADGWKRATLIFKAPEQKLDSMTIAITVLGQGKYLAEDDPGILIDDVELHQVIFPWPPSEKNTGK